MEQLSYDPEQLCDFCRRAIEFYKEQKYPLVGGSGLMFYDQPEEFIEEAIQRGISQPDVLVGMCLVLGNPYVTLAEQTGSKPDADSGIVQTSVIDAAKFSYSLAETMKQSIVYADKITKSRTAEEYQELFRFMYEQWDNMPLLTQ